MRNKLRLNLDQLTVDSFDTSAAAQEKGTVFGEQCTCWTNCTCPGCPTCDNTACGQHTCDASCNGTCDASCNGTCDASCDTCGWSCYYTDCACGTNGYNTGCGDIHCY
jgi:hypothetical protein